MLGVIQDEPNLLIVEWKKDFLQVDHVRMIEFSQKGDLATSWEIIEEDAS